MTILFYMLLLPVVLDSGMADDALSRSQLSLAIHLLLGYTAAAATALHC